MALCSEEVARLFRTHEARVVAIAWRLLRSADDAREVSQEAFARLVAQTEPIENPGAWLCRVAINLSFRRLRSRRPPPAPASPPPQASPEDRKLLNTAIQDLPERQRIVFLLRHEEGMPLVEIAGILGIGPSTAGVHLTRALRALREKLAPHFKELT